MKKIKDFKKILCFIALAAVFVISVMFISSCTKSTDETGSETDLSASSESGLSHSGEETSENTTGALDLRDYLQSPKYYSYLTGLRVSKANQQKRPVSIIINNIKHAMPTVGVARADIIYECMTEGAITRLMMVLTDYEDGPVYGSIRSSREYFIDLSRSHDTIYIHAGGNNQDYDEFDARDIERMDGVNRVTIYGKERYFSDDFFYRDMERRNTMALEHTMMTSGDRIVAALRKNDDYRTKLKDDFVPPFNFNREFTDMGGEDNTANYIHVPYSRVFSAEFIYNPEDNLYYRKQFGVAHIDGETGEQLRFQNVIIMFAEYTPFTGTAQAKAEGHYKCELTGTGVGFYISGGKYKPIIWEKETRDGSLHFYNSDESDLYLNPGKSFICVTQTTYVNGIKINSDIFDIG